MIANDDRQVYVLARMLTYGGRINEAGTILEPEERARLMSEKATAELVNMGTLVPFDRHARYKLHHGLNGDLDANGVPKFTPKDTIWSPPSSHQVWNERAHCNRDVPYTSAEQEQLTAGLVANGTLILATEEPQAVIAEQAATIEQLNAELEELKRKMGVPASLGSHGGTN